MKYSNAIGNGQTTTLFLSKRLLHQRMFYGRANAAGIAQ